MQAVDPAAAERVQRMVNDSLAELSEMRVLAKQRAMQLYT